MGLPADEQFGDSQLSRRVALVDAQDESHRDEIVGRGGIRDGENSLALGEVEERVSKAEEIGGVGISSRVFSMNVDRVLKDRPRFVDERPGFSWAVFHVNHRPDFGPGYFRITVHGARHLE